MSNICKTVNLYTRKIKGGRMLSYFLDYYPGYRDETTNKVLRHESLGIYIYAHPKTLREKDYNARLSEKAEALRCRRYEEIVNERYEFFDRNKLNGSFIDYFKKYAGKKNSRYEQASCTSTCSQAANAPLPKSQWSFATSFWSICAPRIR